MSDIRTTHCDTYCHGKLDLAVLRRDMPCARSLHMKLEIVHVKAGELQVILNEQPICVQEGETLVIDGFVIHEFISPKAEVEAVRAKLQPEWLETPFWDGEERGRFRSLFSGVFVLERYERLKRIFGIVEQCLSQSRPAYRCLISLMELGWLVMEDERLSIRRLPRGTGAHAGMAGALEYLRTHSGEEITPGQLNAYMGMSESYCSKRFHQLMGITFSDLLSTPRATCFPTPTGRSSASPRRQGFQRRAAGQGEPARAAVRRYGAGRRRHAGDVCRRRADGCRI